MKLINCLNPSCGKELTHVEGRRPKKYCSVPCRNVHYKILYASPKKKKESNGLPLPADFLEAKNIGILKEDGTVEKLFNWNGREMILAPLENLFGEKKPLPITTNGEAIPPHPKREDYTDSFEYGVAKADWKKKYNL